MQLCNLSGYLGKAYVECYKFLKRQRAAGFSEGKCVGPSLGDKACGPKTRAELGVQKAKMAAGAPPPTAQPAESEYEELGGCDDRRPPQPPRLQRGEDTTSDIWKEGWEKEEAAG